MKTIIVALCWLGEPWRIDRYQKWLSYHLKLKEELGFEKIVLIDNASWFTQLQAIKGTIIGEDNPDDANPDIHIFRFKEHLPRAAMWDYPYIWRGMDYTKTLISIYKPDKVIFLDSDCYILTPKLAHYIRDLKSGWEAFWCPRYGFPETNLNVLCKDSFKLFLDFPIPSFSHYNGQVFENLMPFTQVNKTGWIGDRYGEQSLPQTEEMDFYAQWQPDSGNMVYDLAHAKTQQIVHTP